MGKIFVVFGLHFGDEGKGTTVDFLTRKYKPSCIVRFCGGPQAAHNVITDDGLHHTFAQLGSGMFVNGTKTFLSEHMLIEPSALMCEEEIFNSKVGEEVNYRVFIDSGCYIINPYDKIFGRLWATISGRSTCGMGVGEASRTVDFGNPIQVKDISNRSLLREKLEAARYSKMEKASDMMSDTKDQIKLFQEMLNVDIEKVISVYEKFYQRYNVVSITDELNKEIKTNNIIFEGSQGILLDRCLGFSPFVTNCDVGTKNLVKMLDMIPYSYIDDSKIIGVIRPYAHRHGYGPLPTEIKKIPWTRDEHNVNNKWQKEFRYGWFDCPLTRYAIEKTATEQVIITNFDRMPDKFKVCENYLLPSGTELRSSSYIESSKDFHVKIQITTPKYIEVAKSDFIDFFENTFGIKVIAVSNGPTAKDKSWRNDV